MESTLSTRDISVENFVQDVTFISTIFQQFCLTIYILSEISGIYG